MDKQNKDYEDNKEEKSDDMTILAKPIRSIPIIHKDKKLQFDIAAENNKVTKDDINMIQDIMKGVVQRKRRGI